MSNVLKLLDDKRLNTNTGKMSVLVLLDLSAAFDIYIQYIYVYHNIPVLLNQLEAWVGLNETVLKWFKFYLGEISYFVTIGSFESD